MSEPGGITVRRVETRDVEAVVALVTSVLGEFGLTFGAGCATDDELHRLPGSYEADGGAFWIAERDGALLGSVGMARTGPDRFELRKMYLLPAARGHGLGQRLLDVALDFAQRAGARLVTLDTTDEMKGAIHLYEKNGFVRDDRCITVGRCTRGYRKELRP